MNTRSWKRRITIATILLSSFSAVNLRPLLANPNLSSLHLASSLQQPSLPALIASVIEPYSGELREGDRIPITLKLLQPLLDSEGKVTVPALSQITGYLNYQDQQAYLTTEYLIANNQAFPIRYLSHPLKISKARIGTERGRTGVDGQFITNAAGVAASAITENEEIVQRIELGAALIGGIKDRIDRKFKTMLHLSPQTPIILMGSTTF